MTSTATTSTATTSTSTPRPPRTVIAYGGATLVVAALIWLAGTVLVRLWLITISLAVALLLTALLTPVVARLRNRSLPPWAAALLSVVLLLAVPGAIGFLVVTRALSRLGEVGNALATAVDRMRDWLVTGPVSLRPEQVEGLRDEIVNRLTGAVPSATATAATVTSAVAGLLLVLFVVFFLLKDGPSIWRWIVIQLKPSHQDSLDVTGRRAWSTLTSYVGAVVVVALIDGTVIGVGLVVIGVPLALPLALLVFLGAFVPFLGATVTGAVAVLVALVTQDLTAAVLVLALVLAVQQLEGNILTPLLMGQAVALHPVVILLSVTAGGLLLGIPGAIIAVPVVAVTVVVVQSLRGRPVPSA